jgi:hypothetical protein
MNARGELDDLMTEELAAFNRLLVEHGLNPLISDDSY